MKPAISRFDRMDMLREAAESSWLLAFLSAVQTEMPRTATELLPHVREGIFRYLRERYFFTLEGQLVSKEEVDKVLRAIADEAVIVKPRHREGAYCIVGRWAISDLGDTHDGEYELAAG